MTNFLDEYVINRVWWMPWKFAAYGWVSDAPYGVCSGRVSPVCSSRALVMAYMKRANPRAFTDYEKGGAL